MEFAILTVEATKKIRTLADAVQALQIVVGMEHSEPVDMDADVDGDGKIGLDEAIYILQDVAGLR